MDVSLIAPCGMNCALCLAFQRDENRCSGCRDDSIKKAETRVRCAIKQCDKRLQNRWLNCSPCEKPCARLKNLDKRYREKYSMSMLENLAYIKQNGIRAFLAQQGRQYTCEKCGNIVCMHTGKCMQCGTENPLTTAL